MKLKVFSVFILLGIVWGGCRLRSRRINNWEIFNPSAKDGTIICFGDSLVAGVGAKDPTGSYTAQLAQLLNRDVIVYGKPGETSQQGLQRLKELPEISQCPIIITLGGNDLLRRVPGEETEAALTMNRRTRPPEDKAGPTGSRSNASMTNADIRHRYQMRTQREIA